jgi:LysM repeat protein
MRRMLLVSLLLLLGFGLGGPAHAWQEPTNLLQNPGFEGDYFAWSNIPEVQVAHGWTPWWRERTDTDPPATYFKPEYKQANAYIYPNRVHSGIAAQQWFTFYSTHQAGMYQQVFNVTPGTRYRFTIWAQVWSSTEDNPDVSINPAYPSLQVGIDPTGNWNPWADTVAWSGTYAFYDSWGQLAVEAVAQNHIITVFMRSRPEFPVKHNDMYWDDAVLVAVGEGGVPLPPPPTPIPPTATSVGPPPPTATPSGPPSPTATCAAPPADWTTYHVQRGDTLYGLAKRHGTTLDAVIAANCLRSTTIYVGQALLLPPLPASATPSGPTATPTAAQATATAKPTKTPTTAVPATPTEIPATPSPTGLPATPTPAPVTTTTQPTWTQAAATPTQSRPTIPPPFTPTTGLPPTPATAAPPSGSTRPCGTIALSAGIVLLAGVIRFRRR